MTFDTRFAVKEIGSPGGWRSSLNLPSKFLLVNVNLRVKHFRKSITNERYKICTMGQELSQSCRIEAQGQPSCHGRGEGGN